jgi:pimeloyl-ACP methyl ester carboxylesterase
MSAGERLPGTPTPMHTWTGAGGLTIAGDTWGDPNGPLVVLQHGGGQTRHAWRGAGEALGNAGYHAVAFDARGHGDSGWAPADEYGPDYVVKDLICVVKALGGKRPILVGASMGGGVSLIAPDLARWMASPKMSASAPMASITGTGILPAAACRAIGRPTGSDCTPAPTICTCRRSWCGVASPTC